MANFPPAPHAYVSPPAPHAFVQQTPAPHAYVPAQPVPHAYVSPPAPHAFVPQTPAPHAYVPTTPAPPAFAPQTPAPPAYVPPPQAPSPAVTPPVSNISAGNFKRPQMDDSMKDAFRDFLREEFAAFATPNAHSTTNNPTQLQAGSPVFQQTPINVAPPVAPDCTRSCDGKSATFAAADCRTDFSPTLSDPSRRDYSSQKGGDGWSRGRSANMADNMSEANTSRRHFNPGLWRLRYKGNSDIGHYLAQFECVARAQDWDDTEKGTILLSNLEGDASRVMVDIPGGCISYTVIARKLRDMFAPEVNIVAYRAQFQCRQRHLEEAPHEFALALRELVSKAFPSLDHTAIESMLVDQYIKGQPQYAKFALAGVAHKTLQEAVAATVRVEAYSRPAAAPSPVSQGLAPPASQFYKRGQTNRSDPVALGTLPGKSARAAQSRADSSDEMEEASNVYADLFCQLMGVDLPETAAECHNVGSNTSRPCYFCGKPGHFWGQCRALLEQLKSRGFTGATPITPFQGRGRTNPRGSFQRQGSNPSKSRQDGTSQHVNVDDNSVNDDLNS